MNEDKKSSSYQNIKSHTVPFLIFYTITKLDIPGVVKKLKSTSREYKHYCIFNPLPRILNPKGPAKNNFPI